MFYLSRIAPILCSMLLVAACDDAANEQSKSTGTQTTANTQVINETNAGAKKVAAAQVEAKENIAAAQAEADQKSNAAQSEADSKAAAAKEALQKAREEYRHDLETKLIELDRSISELELKAKKASGKTHVDLHARLKKIRAQREVVARSSKSLDSDSTTSWDDIKARIDREWTELKTLLDVR